MTTARENVRVVSGPFCPRPRAVARSAATALVSVLALILGASAVGALVVPGSAAAASADPAPNQWQLDSLRAEAAWQEATGAGVTVAVVDSGVDATHPDLAGQVLRGVDFVAPGGGDGRVDPVGHGTTVAGLIAGRRDKPDGAVGLAPAARILPVRVLDAHNRYDDALLVARGVQWAVDHGATVINLSLGGAKYNAALADALDYAFARDVVVVACTGNRVSGTGTDVWFPAREPGVVAVAGLESDPATTTDPLWSSSLTGAPTVLTAPAANLLGAQPGGGHWRVQGTSFAAPLVSATAALIRSKWPEMSAGTVVARLIETARDLGVAGRDNRYGFGAVDPVAALRADIAPVSANPLDTEVSPPGHAGFGAASEPLAGQDPAASPGPPSPSISPSPGGPDAPDIPEMPDVRTDAVSSRTGSRIALALVATA